MLQLGSEPKVVLDCRNCLGESIVWDDRERRLYWVNIHNGEVWSWDPDPGSEPVILRLPERVGALGLREAGGLVLALAKGFALFDPNTSRLQKLTEIEADLPTTRLNDGRIDPAGRFVCGGMDEGDPQQPLSAVYSLDHNQAARRIIHGISCANSICWSPDGRIMYFTDMPSRRIDAFDYDPETGDLTHRRVFADLRNEPGAADGSIIDAEGCLWNAQWRGSKLVRYRPDGTVEREVPLPVSNPTCLAFGGDNLDILFVTTAWFTLSDKERTQEPHAGSLFAFRPGVRGRREYRYIDQ
jgi:L-arabinonolactonase